MNADARKQREIEDSVVHAGDEVICVDAKMRRGIKNPLVLGRVYRVKEVVQHQSGMFGYELFDTKTPLGMRGFIFDRFKKFYRPRRSDPRPYLIDSDGVPPTAEERNVLTGENK